LQLANWKFLLSQGEVNFGGGGSGGCGMVMVVIMLDVATIVAWIVWFTCLFIGKLELFSLRWHGSGGSAVMVCELQ
jgi:hypothetical protein